MKKEAKGDGTSVWTGGGQPKKSINGLSFRVRYLVFPLPLLIIQPIYVNNGTERQTKFYKADFFTNTLDMTL